VEQDAKRDFHERTRDEHERIHTCGSNGRWYVHAAKANEFLAKSKATPVETPVRTDDGRIHAAVIALCEINNGITLMQATLERLTAAVESIATQPKAEPAGTWRDMNGESL